VKTLGITGPFLVQLKVDARDAKPRILEANCKLSYRIWTAKVEGLDIPRLTLAATQGTSVTGVEPTRFGTVFVNVPEFVLARFTSPERARVVREAIGQGPVAPDPYSLGFGRRPHIALLWWITFLGFAYKEELARRLRDRR
jgi:hypothetical protein